jgi:3D (Asp-Asp-Asp) domain-containing protein
MYLSLRNIPASGRIATAICILAVFCGVAIGSVAKAGDDSVRASRVVSKPAWMPKMLLTEYFPAREQWFDGVRVPVPGVKRRPSKIDWLYSAKGVAMEGDGLGTDGQRYHVEVTGSNYWIGRDGKKASWGSSSNMRVPYWLSVGYWKNRKKQVTYLKHDGSWSNLIGKRWIPPKNITFARGPSRPLKYYRSVAVDPGLIPMGSLVWIGRYSGNNGDGWFRADDTGGAIDGRHIDVYVKPPTRPTGGSSYAGQRIYVVPKAKIASYLRRETKADTDGLPLPPRSLR